jgi:hypothetical protein
MKKNEFDCPICKSVQEFDNCNVGIQCKKCKFEFMQIFDEASLLAEIDRRACPVCDWIIPNPNCPKCKVDKRTN